MMAVPLAVILTTGGAAFGAVAGEFLKNYIGRCFDGARKIEAARDNDVAEIAETIDSIIGNCEAYWEVAAGDLGTGSGRLEARITAELQHINHLCSEMFHEHADSRQVCEDEWREFHKMCTEGDFSDHGRAAEPRRLTAIWLAGLKLRRGVTARRKNLPKHWLG